MVSLAAADQTAANADQKVSGADQRACNSVGALAALDQQASDTDQARTDRQHAGATDVTPSDEREYQDARRQQESVFESRVISGMKRARTGRDCDAAAGQRDRTGDDRDERAQARDKQASGAETA